MKTIKQSITLLSLSLAVFISSCKQSKMLPISFTGHNKVEFAGVALNGVKGKVTVHIKNPNPLDVTIFKSNFDIRVNDIAIGKAKTRKKIVIPANSEVEQVLYLKSDFSNIGYSDIPKVLKTVQSKNIQLSVKGNLKSGRFIHKTKNPVCITDTIKLDEKAKPVLTFISKIGTRSMQFLSKGQDEY